MYKKKSEGGEMGMVFWAVVFMRFGRYPGSGAFENAPEASMNFASRSNPASVPSTLDRERSW